MPFSDEQYFQSIDNSKTVKEAYYKIKEACQSLQDKTNCPDEDIDNFLQFVVGKWK